MEKQNKKLTKRQEAFVNHMADPTVKSKTEAARRAGYSPNTARFEGSRNTTKYNISEAIMHRRARAMAHYQITPEEVLGASVFQMRSSIDDVLDEDGSFSIDKARETGAVDLLKKHKETIKTFAGENGTEITKTVEVEMLTNQDGRKEVAGYIGLTKEPLKLGDFSDLELAKEMLRRLVEKHKWKRDEAIKAISEDFPDIDIKLLSE